MTREGWQVMCREGMWRSKMEGKISLKRGIKKGKIDSKKKKDSLKEIFLRGHIIILKTTIHCTFINIFFGGER